MKDKYGDVIGKARDTSCCDTEIEVFDLNNRRIACMHQEIFSGTMDYKLKGRIDRRILIFIPTFL